MRNFASARWRATRCTLIAVVLGLGAGARALAALATDDVQRIEVHRNGASGDTVAITVGIPFAPGQLTDARRVRILDAKGHEIAAHVEPVLTWHFKDGSIRAVRAQFHAPLLGDQAELHFSFNEPRSLEAPGWPIADEDVDGGEGVRMPGALATLSPQWLCASLIAGPQVPMRADNAYDRYVDTQFDWARKLPSSDSTAWLFDRASTLYKLYVRSGRLDYLRAAVASYRFYMSHVHREGPAFHFGLHPHSECLGGWAFDKVKPCDVKYVYIEPILLALALSGDDSRHDATLVRHMAAVWDSGGWSGISGAYENIDQIYTERHTGLGLIEIVAAYEVTGDEYYRLDIARRIGWLQQHQTKNPDGQPADGSWRHSWQKHEGDDYDPETDVRGASPWMSENIVDGLWHAWLVTADSRIPAMLTAFGRYLERYGWIDTKSWATSGHDWRDPCSGSDGQIAWYWSSSSATPEQLVKIQDSEGWYSDFHTVELGLAVALARYFETDPAERAVFDQRLARIAHSYAPACAKNASTARRFNWNNRGAGVVQWLATRQYTPPVAEAKSP